MKFPKFKTWRSEKHRRNVAKLACVICGSIDVQVCHANATKGLALKACDSLTWPMCPTHHRQHDTGGIPKAVRWKLEWEYVDATRARLIQMNLWPAEVERAYQVAIQPLVRVVHGEAA